MPPKKSKSPVFQPRRSVRLNPILVEPSVVVKKRRGRPPKIKSTAVVQKEIRRRGRPPKNENRQLGQPPIMGMRRRGRPPKNRIESDEESEKESESEDEENGEKEKEGSENDHDEDDERSAGESDYEREEMEKMKRLKIGFQNQSTKAEPIVPGQPEFDQLQALLRRKRELALNNVAATTPLPQELSTRPPVPIAPVQHVENRLPVKVFVQEPKKIDGISCPVCFKLFAISDTAEAQFEYHVRVFHAKFWMQQTGNRSSPPPTKKSKTPEKESEHIKTELDYMPNFELGPCQRCRSLGIQCGMGDHFQARDNRNWFEF